MTEKHLGHFPAASAGDPWFEIELDLASTGSRGSIRSLLRELKAAIDDGRLTAGAKLPPTRKSAAFFGVSRNTAAEVYETLLHEGYVVTRRGAGTYVADRQPASRPRAVLSGDAGDGGGDQRLNAFWLRSDVAAAMGFWRDRVEPRTAPSRDRPVDFRPALVDSRLFPFDVFRRVSARELRSLERKPASLRSPQGNQGNRGLREATARHLALTRAVVCEAGDIVVTSGAQQAFDLLARTLVTPGKTVVALEDPGYPPMRIAFAAAGARLVPVRVDDEGLIVEQVPTDAGVICVCPSHQFPLGSTMSVTRRQALVELARSQGAVIVEDDYDGEFRYGGSPLGALRTTAAADVVFYVGTFSKSMFSALRLGFIVAPEWALRTLVTAKNSLDWHCSTPVQLAVAGFIAEGHLAQHVRRMREIYRQRRARLLDALRERLGDWFEPIPSFYGMHVAAVACAGVDHDLDAVTDAILRRDVRLHALTRYHMGAPTRRGFVFGYGAVDLDDISRGVEVLRDELARR